MTLKSHAKKPTSWIIGVYFIGVFAFIIFLNIDSKPSTETPILHMTNETASQVQLATPLVPEPETILENYPEFTSIPSDFKSQSIIDLHSKVSQLIGSKSEYQSTAEYDNQKKENISKNPLLFKGYILLNDTGYIFTNYNADSKKLVIKYDDQISESKTYNLGDYIGSNAFGVSKQIRKYSRTIYSLKFDNAKSQRNINISLESDIARDHDHALAILYIAQLSAPYLKPSTSDYHKPTIDEAEEAYLTYETLHGTLKGLIVYNKKTGEILVEKRMSD